MESSSKLLRVILAALDRGALDPLSLDVREVTSFADTVVLLSARSDRQARAVADGIIDTVREDGDPPLGVEGLAEGRWILIDCNDVIVHVFAPEIRDEYDLERLWSDAPEIDLLALGVPAEEIEQAKSHNPQRAAETFG